MNDNIATSSWERVDLTTVLDAAYKPIVPTVGERDDGLGLFYLGKIHAVGSESEGGKTWLMLVVAATEMARGNNVVYIDFEDDEATICGRLQVLGISASLIRDHLVYIRPVDPLNTIAKLDLLTMIETMGSTLVIIDGVTECMALHGWDIKDNTHIAILQNRIARPICRLGPAVVLLDHVVKDQEARGRYDIGGVHKLNGIDGASYSLLNRSPFGIGRTGVSSLFIRKDRPAQLRQHALPSGEGLFWLADLVVSSHGEDFAEASFPLPHGSSSGHRYTVLMKKVSDVLAKSGDLSLRQILDRVSSKQEYVRSAVADLVDADYVTVKPGPRGAHLHHLVKPFGGG